MTVRIEEAEFASLQRRLPLFPLAGALLLPGGQLPLNIFEPRYLAMTRDALAGSRLIGMVQPTNPGAAESAPEIYRTGCLGRIGRSRETNDGRILITLTGVCRFHVVEELKVTTPYRQAIVSYARFRADFDEDDGSAVDRGRFLETLRSYLTAQGIKADWATIAAAPTGALVTSLAMVCPFAPNEKQALLEARNVDDRARAMTALMSMAKAGERVSRVSGVH